MKNCIHLYDYTDMKEKCKKKRTPHPAFGHLPLEGKLSAKLTDEVEKQRQYYVDYFSSSFVTT